MKQTLLLLQLMAFFSVCYSYTRIIGYKCTYRSLTGATTVKTCDKCCTYDCCPVEPAEPIDGKYLAIILCCSFGVPAIIIICTVCVVHRVRRRRLAQLQARNREIAAEHLTTLFILSSLRQQEARATGSEVTSSLADPPRYETVVEGQS